MPQQIFNFDDRITPARAGTTSGIAPKFLTFRDHPRSRGDHFTSVTGLLTRLGSPPLARGPR